MIARLQTFEEPNIQRFGVRQYVDASISDIILLFRINDLYKVGICLNTYQNILNSFYSSCYNLALAPSKVYRWLCPKFI